MIETILPPAVVAEEAFADVPGTDLHPEEWAIVARAVESRRREFATTRRCARVALRRLGVDPVPVLAGERGAPRWPAGVVGSMTHCSGYRAAVVARSRDVLTVGVDAEPHDALPAEVLDLVTVPDERPMLRDLSASAPGTHWETVLFSAKEAVYKAWFPLTGSWLGFDEARLSVDPGTGGFVARLLVPGPVVGGRARQELEGRFLVRDGIVLTAVTLVPGALADPGPPVRA